MMRLRKICAGLLIASLALFLATVSNLLYAAGTINFNYATILEPFAIFIIAAVLTQIKLIDVFAILCIAALSVEISTNATCDAIAPNLFVFILLVLSALLFGISYGKWIREKREEENHSNK